MNKFLLHTKCTEKRNWLRTITAPGGLISIEKIKFYTPVFIGQLKLTSTKQFYHTMAVFIYQHSDISYIYL